MIEGILEHHDLAHDTRSLLNFRMLRGADLLKRTEAFYPWLEARREAQCWPYSNVLHAAPHPEVTISDDMGRVTTGLNFASQDYLSLTRHPEILKATQEALDVYGPHSAGSPCLQGNTKLSVELEEALAETLRVGHVLLFPTGWMAGFGIVTGLVRPDDHVILDQLAHNCLAQGAAAATRNVHRFRHLSTDAVADKLRLIRRKDSENGILVITEGIFSMDADSPDIPRLQEICRTYNATLLVDVAHDFGSLGPKGTGVLGMQGMLGNVDVVIGSFSKTFASNGGFVAVNSSVVKQYVKYYSPSHVFSNALSPVQAATALAALRVVISPEGEMRRKQLVKVVRTLREALAGYNIHCLGAMSPIVPVPLGSETLARFTGRSCFQRGLLANLVEFPAVAVGQARFRMQAMADHTEEHARRAAQIIGECLEETRLSLVSA
jgi:glycine C-acetyltransferase